MRIEYFFSVVFYPNIWVYILSLALVIIVYRPIFKRTVKSIMDPMCIAMIGLILANSIPVFLFMISQISVEKFIHFILSEVFFWIAFFLFRNRSKSYFSNYRMIDGKIINILFYIFLALMISCNIITYALIGIPLFLNSRLETYTSGGGIGILSHIIDFSTFYCSVFIFYLYSNGKRIFGAITFFLIIIFSFFSGSKSSILTLVFGYFFYLYYYKEGTINYVKLIKFIPALVVFPIIILSFQNNDNFWSGFISLIVRMVSYGDGYWVAYPYNDIDKVQIISPVIYLFSGILGPLRIIEYSDLEPAIGIQLANIAYPELTILTGPNARLALLNWALFRWWGLILCPIMGIIFAWITTRLVKVFPHSIISTIIYGYIYTRSMTFLTDPVYGFNRIFSVMVFLSVLWILFITLGKSKIKFYKNE